MTLFATTCLVVVITLMLAAVPRSASAQAVQLFGTLGYGGTPSTLVELNPANGALLRTIGPVGYMVNGLTYDPATGRLYGGTSYNDPNFNGLILINMSTGAGTPVGAINWGLTTGFTPVTNITVDSIGRMFGWYEYSDNLVSINKTTGIATEVGASGVGTYQNGLSFNRTDVLYMVNGDGSIYTVNTATGAATYQGSIGTTAHHGDFHPVSDLWYGLTWTYGDPRTLLACDLGAESCTDVGAVGDLHTLTFVPAQAATATPTATASRTSTPTSTPAPPTATPIIASVGGVAVGSVGSGQAPAAVTPAPDGRSSGLLTALALLLGALVAGTAYHVWARRG